MRIEPLGDSALLVRVVGEFEPEQSLEAVLGTAEALRSVPGVVELVPAYTTIGVFFDPGQAGPLDELITEIEAALESQLKKRRFRALGKMIEVPVCYHDADFAPDLDVVARHTGLSPEEVIARHSAAEYRVSCVGFTPGFPYLSGLPIELVTPRRASPRKEVPAGAVAIGGAQTGIYPRKSPGGWNVIGRTPLRLFEVERDPPAMFQAGDRVQFRSISREEFEEMAR